MEAVVPMSVIHLHSFENVSSPLLSSKEFSAFSYNFFKIYDFQLNFY